MTLALPELSDVRIRKELGKLGYTRGPRRMFPIQAVEAIRHSWGKLVSKYCYHLVTRIIKTRDSSIRLSYDLFMRLAIAETIDAMRGGKLVESAAYYRGLSHVFV
jgi:hypothetical protein